MTGKSKGLNHEVASLRPPRCLSRVQAAEYLGIGVTLLKRIGPVPIHLGRRLVYDLVDLDAWLDEHKGRGRAMKEVSWPENVDSIDGRTHLTGGSISRSRMDAEYARALGLRDATNAEEF